MRKILLILFVLLFFISCREERESDVLNVAISQDVASLDVMKSSSRVLRDILIGSVYEKLFVLDGGEIKNELASSYRLSDDGKYLAIDIRKDVMMHDGSVMSPHDVASSLNRYIDSYEPASDMTGSSRFIETPTGVEIYSERPLYLFIYLIGRLPSLHPAIGGIPHILPQADCRT